MRDPHVCRRRKKKRKKRERAKAKAHTHTHLSVDWIVLHHHCDPYSLLRPQQRRKEKAKAEKHTHTHTLALIGLSSANIATTTVFSGRKRRKKEDKSDRTHTNKPGRCLDYPPPTLQPLLSSRGAGPRTERWGRGSQCFRPLSSSPS